MDYTEDFYFTTVENVLYRPRRIIFIIRGEAENDKNDPERPILHIFWGGKIKIRGLVHSSGVSIYTQLYPLYEVLI